MNIEKLENEMSEASKSMTAYAISHPPHAMPDRYYYWLRKFQGARKALNKELEKRRVSQAQETQNCAVLDEKPERHITSATYDRIQARNHREICKRLESRGVRSFS